jgi:uncharacterized protein
MADPIVHIEISAQDLGQSSKFYSEIFGWELTPWGDSGYVMFKAGDGPGGGLMQADESGKWPPVLIYIHVSDIEAKLKVIEAAGGKIVTPKTPIAPEFGFFAVFTDPAGNSIGLHSMA